MVNLSRICFLTPADRPIGESEPMVRAALEAGIRFVQYRRKDICRRELYFEALRLRDLTGSYNATFIVNDHADIALAVQADGLHVGQDDLPLAEARKIMGQVMIGVSTHSLAQAVEALKGGADYIGFGPIFPTNTKDAGQPKGAEAIRDIRASMSIPVIAIGGITTSNAREVFAAGCDGIAVSAGISNGDIRANVAAFIACLPE
jgi:thiamine-phosphate pyrophosphorylase